MGKYVTFKEHTTFMVGMKKKRETVAKTTTTAVALNTAYVAADLAGAQKTRLDTIVAKLNANGALVTGLDTDFV